jgi:16S rRNA (adenine1518-N6/adenine1519-N6)-dimethyltransferase
MFQKEEAQFVEKREQKRMEFYRFWFRLFMMHLFTVDEHVFIPPPKVKSVFYACAEKGLQFAMVKIILYCRKTAFQQRRKTYEIV